MRDGLRRFGQAFGGMHSAPGAKHPIDHHAGLSEVVGRIAHRIELRSRDVLVDLRVCGEDLDQRPIFGE